MEALEDRLRGLLREREHLRGEGGGVELERNRLEIGRVQWALARALAARYAGY